MFVGLPPYFKARLDEIASMAPKIDETSQNLLTASSGIKQEFQKFEEGLKSIDGLLHEVFEMLNISSLEKLDKV